MYWRGRLSTILSVSPQGQIVSRIAECLLYERTDPVVSWYGKSGLDGAARQEHALGLRHHEAYKAGYVAAYITVHGKHLEDHTKPLSKERERETICSYVDPDEGVLSWPLPATAYEN